MRLTELADRIGLTLANLSIIKTGKAYAAGTKSNQRPSQPAAISGHHA
jgi:hypothetical protein